MLHHNGSHLAKSHYTRMKLENTTSNGEISAFDDKLPFKLGIILLSATIFTMAIGIILVTLRRKKAYNSVLDAKDDRCVDEDDELANFEVGNGKHFTYRSMDSKAQLAPVNCAKTHTAEPSAFSIGDEGEELSDHETCIYSQAVIENLVPTKVIRCTTADPQNSDASESRMAMSRNVDATAVRSKAMLNDRRFSSTPNLPTACSDSGIDNGTTADSQGDDADGPVDESSLFDEKEFRRGLWFDSSQPAEGDDRGAGVDNLPIITPSTAAASSLHVTTGSLGDIGCMRPLLSLRLPAWATASGRAEYGMLLFTLALRNGRQAGEGQSDGLLLDVGVLEAHCILSHHVEPRAGKFYVKARLFPQDMSATSASSVSSLDQLNSKQHGFLRRIRSLPRSSGRTPIRQAFRSPVFRHIVTVRVPPQLASGTDAKFGSATVDDHNLNSDSAVLAPATGQIWELRLDLKERRALKTEELFGGHTGIALPSWKSSQLLSSVRLSLGRRIWRHLLDNYDEFDSPLRRSTLIPQSTEQASEPAGSDKQAGRAESKMLIFVRPLEPQWGDQGVRGQLTIGVQYNTETARLDVYPIKCFGVIIPKLAHGLFLRASLMSNRKLIDSQQSNLTARLTLNAAEFLLGERVQFSVEESLSQVCLLFSIFCRSGRRFNESGNLIGRCIVGPSGLAYGEGLMHWTDMSERKVVVKRTHVLW